MLIGVLVACGLLLAWLAADALLLVFAGLLLAAALDACARCLRTLLPMGRRWGILLVGAGVAIAIAGWIVWSGVSIAGQFNIFLNVLEQQTQALQHGFRVLGIAPDHADRDLPVLGRITRLLFPNPRQLLGEAQSVFELTLGGIGSATVIVLVGAFVAADPVSHRDWLLELLPSRHRRRFGKALEETAHFVRRWLVGQLVAMLLLAGLTWVALLALGVPNALLLAVQAGLFNFVPYLGAIVAAGPILLMSLPLGIATTSASLALFALIHVGIGYVIVPLIQKQAVNLPPAVTLAALVIFATLFGLAGIAVATPLIAAIRQFYLSAQAGSLQQGPTPTSADDEACDGET